MKNFLLLLLISFSNCRILSQEISVDTFRVHSKMNRDQYLKYMAIDTTSQKLINFYFDQRSHGLTLICFLPVNLGAILLTPVAVYSPVLTAPVAVIGAIKLNKWSRRKLFNTLASYHKGEPLNPSILERMYK